MPKDQGENISEGANTSSNGAFPSAERVLRKEEERMLGDGPPAQTEDV